MKYTLLDLTQTILSSMDSDEVNSISDTTESMQVANIIKTVYFDIVNRANLPEHNTIVTLDASTDAAKPTLMTRPLTVDKMMWLKYNKIETTGDPINMQEVTFLPLYDFFNMIHSFDSSDTTNVGTYTITSNGNTFTVLYKKNKQPDYYTNLDDSIILFDSYRSTVENTLQKANTMCYAKLNIPFSLTDTFVPNLDDEQFALLLNDAKSLAWTELKQTPHQIAERNSRRGWVNLNKSKNNVDPTSDFDRLPNFGRIRNNFSRFKS